jgi:prepilin-type N-terminal cleavage/methylation domain-containing protein
MRTLKEKKNKQRGFTLVELLITIALIAGMVLIGSPSILRQLSHLRLTRATRDISVELQAARLKAIAQNIPYRVSFTLNTYPTSAYPTSDTYRLQLFSGGSWQNDATRAPRDLPDTVDITSPGSNFQTEFKPNGTGTAVDICIQNKKDSTDRMKINVSSFTGRVSIQTGC